MQSQPSAGYPANLNVHMSNPAYMPASINRQLAAGIPEPLREGLLQAREAFTEAATAAGYALPEHPEFIASLMRVWACSDFVRQDCIRDPAVLLDQLADGSLLGDYAADEYRHRLQQALLPVRDEEQLLAELRHFRRREMLRIAWRDLAGWAPLDEVLRDLSGLADACISAALHWLGAQLAQEHGIRESFSPSLVVLGMGKLGAHELNFSSDIDLIFAYPESESKPLGRRITAHEFYLQLGQRLIRSLDAKTQDGFVFRVDMRLRPYGDSGQLVASFDAMVDYYQLQGREWERYAMIKARPVAGPERACKALIVLLRPFVYRRYLDFGAFDSLRGLKLQIIGEVERKGMLDNIKLGPGGIREIEFVVQAFQLVRGGRQPVLQQRQVLTILRVLAELGYLPATVTLELAEAYVFLRRTENRLQAVADQQVHELPEDQTSKLRLAWAMGFPDWESFRHVLDAHRQRVQVHFDQVFADPQQREVAGASDLAGVWNGTADAQEAALALTAAGYPDAEAALAWLEQFRHGPVSRHLGEQGRRRLDELMPRVLKMAAGNETALDVLKRIGDLLEAIAGRTTYLTLLVEHPLALDQLARLCGASSWVATLLARYPILLDELLDPRALFDPLDRAGLGALLEARMSGVADDDLEQQMDRLRQFRQAQTLHVAAADILTGLAVTRVADSLTLVAEVVLEKVVKLSFNHIVTRYGRPKYLYRGKLREAGFAVVGYGKLGGREMGYGSDLDIVFLHDSSGDEQHTAGPRVIDNSEFFTRLSQRVIHLLNTFTAAGVLYEVDMRLRPNGNSGLLVSSLDAFAEYQRRSAWTWENQALIRARVVVGNGEISRQFERIRSGVLARPRVPDKLRAEVVDMRSRMRQELDKAGPGEVDLKHGPGGIVDIEFMVQFGVLCWSGEHDGLLRYTWTLGLLRAFREYGLMPADAIDALSAAYCALRQRINHRVLHDATARVDSNELAAERAAVCRVWQRLMGEM
jgi:[glutamine synthetase] adenylyltransferase / [glutamine synthetase]-adenylyl-L-tyrosine phosphorylase